MRKQATNGRQDHMQGIFVNGKRPTSKKAIKEAVANIMKRGDIIKIS